MRRLDAIKTMLGLLGADDIALFTTGMISREAFYARDRSANFYMVGSMGLIASLGLGIALNTGKKVFIFDGDGSILMDMGTMPMIGKEAPKNLIHIVLDNEAYQSTGSQETISRHIDLSRIAGEAGYACAHKIDKHEELAGIFSDIREKPGPSFLLIKVSKEGARGIGRVSLKPPELTGRIREAITDTCAVSA